MQCDSSDVMVYQIPEMYILYLFCIAYARTVNIFALFKNLFSLPN